MPSVCCRRFISACICTRRLASSALKRLVEQQDFRLGDQRAGNRDALPLPARQHRHPPIEKFGEADHFGDLGDLRVDGRAVELLQLEAEFDVAADIEMREQRVILPDQPHIALMHRHLVDGLAAREQRAAVGGFQAGDDAQQGRLAAAARPHDRQELAALDGEAHIVEREAAVETLRDRA